MSRHVLSVTDLSGTGKIYYSSTGVPFSLALVLSVPGQVFDRCLIDPFSPQTLYAGGSGILMFSLDGGASWGSSAINAFEVRSLIVPEAGILYVGTKGKLYRSNDHGQSVSLVNQPSSDQAIADTAWWTADIGYLATNDPVLANAYLHYTLNAGTSWEELLLTGLSGWTHEEAVRRVWILNADQITDSDLYLLTTHRLLRVRHPSGAMGATPTVTVLWSFVPQLSALFPLAPDNGFTPVSQDVSTYFDDIHATSGRIWLGGYYGLRAHSFGSFVLTDPLAFNVNQREWYATHRGYDLNEIMVSSAEIASALPPLLPGLNESMNGGLTTTPFHLFAGKELVRGVSLLEFDSTPGGCTDPDACNYDDNIGIDDGSCQHAVKLIDCQSGEAIDCNSPDIAALACRGPAFSLFPARLDPTMGSQALKIVVNGVPVIQYNSFVPIGGVDADRMAEYVGGLVFFINSTTAYRASIIPAADNPFIPGFFGAIRIVAPSSSQAGEFCSETNIGFFGFQMDSELDGGSPGAVIRVTEHPGSCYRVCGTGDCSLALPLTLSSSHASCSSCQPALPPSTCMDCAAQLSVAGVPSYASQSGCAQCVSVGSIFNFHLNIGFKGHTPEVLTPIEAGTILQVGVPPILNFVGDMSEYFPVNMIIPFADGSGLSYVVDSISYDAGPDVTTVTFFGAYQGANPITTVTAFSSCSESVTTTVELVTGTGDNLTFTTVMTRTDSSVNHQVELLFDVPVADYGRYRITVAATDCSGTRTCEYWYNACGDLVVQQGSCHNFYVSLLRPEGSFSSGSVFHVLVQDLSDGSVKVDTDVSDTAFPFKLVGGADTVYLITVTTPDGQQLSAEVIDLCDLLKCRANLTMDILCEDPCTADTMTVAEKQARLELSRISILSAEIERLVYDMRYQALGLPESDLEGHQMDLAELGQVIAAVRKVAARCADCDKPKGPCLPCGN